MTRGVSAVAWDPEGKGLDGKRRKNSWDKTMSPRCILTVCCAHTHCRAPTQSISKVEPLFFFFFLVLFPCCFQGLNRVPPFSLLHPHTVRSDHRSLLPSFSSSLFSPFRATCRVDTHLSVATKIVSPTPPLPCFTLRTNAHECQQSGIRFLFYLRKERRERHDSLYFASFETSWTEWFFFLFLS